MPNRNENFGFTIIETLVTLAVLGIALGIAFPSFTAVSQKQALVKASEQFVTDMQIIRTSAIKQNSNVSVSFSSSNAGADWCYGATDTATTCDCTTNNACTMENAAMRRNNTQYNGVSMSVSNLPAGSLTIRPRGMTGVAATQITFSTGNGASITAKINPLGRVNLCSSSYSNYAAC